MILPLSSDRHPNPTMALSDRNWGRTTPVQETLHEMCGPFIVYFVAQNGNSPLTAQGPCRTAPSAYVVMTMWSWRDQSGNHRRVKRLRGDRGLAGIGDESSPTATGRPDSLWPHKADDFAPRLASMATRLPGKFPTNTRMEVTAAACGRVSAIRQVLHGFRRWLPPTVRSCLRYRSAVEGVPRATTC